MSNMSDDATYVVETSQGEAHGLIFRPGDTLILRMPTETLADYSDEELNELVATLRQTMGEGIEVIVLGKETEIHKAVRVPSKEN